jgi:hypothetical protein
VPAWSDDALRLRMLLMGLSLLRCAIHGGMRGVAASIFGQLTEQTHRKALSTLLAAVNESECREMHLVEVRCGCSQGIYCCTTETIGGQCMLETLPTLMRNAPVDYQSANLLQPLIHSYWGRAQVCLLCQLQPCVLACGCAPVQAHIACLLTGRPSRQKPSAKLSAVLRKHVSAASGAAPPLPGPLPALVDADGQTFLHLAVQSGSMGMVADAMNWSHTEPGCLLVPGEW